MIQDKVLIFNYYEPDINKGGPIGFISHNFIDKPRDKFVLLSDLNSYIKNKYLRGIRILSSKFYCISKEQAFLSTINHIRQLFYIHNCSNYKYIYFHDCLSLYALKDMLNPRQVVILQSHSPQLPSWELKEQKHNQKSIDFFEKAEKFSFEKADIIVFPNERSADLYQDLIHKPEKLKYILSGAKAYSSLRLYPLDQSKINLLYIGRREATKGFDLLIDTFFKIRKEREDLRLLLLGNGADLTTDDKSIIDLGFTTTPNNWYNSVDYVINANRISYFDLSVIEALSTGVPMILSASNGHNYYKNKSEDIICYDSNNNFGLFDVLKSSSLTKKETRSISNINLYQHELSDIEYIKRFNLFVDGL